MSYCYLEYNISFPLTFTPRDPPGTASPVDFLFLQFCLISKKKFREEGPYRRFERAGFSNRPFLFVQTAGKFERYLVTEIESPSTPITLLPVRSPR